MTEYNRGRVKSIPAEQVNITEQVQYTLNALHDSIFQLLAVLLKLRDPDLTSLKFKLFQSIKRKRLAELFKISPALHDL